MGDSWLLTVLRDPVTPAYLALLIFAGACLRWGGGIMAAFTERLRVRANIYGEDHTRLREENKQRADENSMLRNKLNECEAARIEWMHRAVTAESMLLGLGEAKQTAQRSLSADRLEDRKKKDAPNG